MMGVPWHKMKGSNANGKIVADVKHINVNVVPTGEYVKIEFLEDAVIGQ
jgi:hypothetical protein